VRKRPAPNIAISGMCLLLLIFALWEGPGLEGAGVIADSTEIPQAFRITPSRQSHFSVVGVFYNPKILYKASPERRFYGGKLWGFYLDDEGNLEDKLGNDKLAPIALTVTFLDPSAGMFFDTMVHNSKDNSYLAVYEIKRTGTTNREIWGLIYK